MGYDKLMTLTTATLLTLAFRFCYAASSLIELPACQDSALLLFHPGCVIRYNEETRLPDWAAYKLTASEVRSTEASRTDRFRADPEVPSLTAVEANYRKSGYDRGHLAPAADMRFSRSSMTASFFFSNIAPQYPGLNRGVWSKIEALTREEALRNGAVYIATGPIFYRDRVTRDRVFIGPDKIPVPDAFFKILLVHNHDTERAIAFIIPNGPTSSEISRYAMSVDEAERITGIDFFYYLSNASENAVEAVYSFDEWFQ